MSNTDQPITTPVTSHRCKSHVRAYIESVTEEIVLGYGVLTSMQHAERGTVCAVRNCEQPASVTAVYLYTNPAEGPWA